MKLTQIVIDHFRSFKRPTTIDLSDIYTGLPNDRLIFIGSNASGKTTLIEMVLSLIKASYGEEDSLYKELLNNKSTLSISFEGIDGRKLSLEYSPKEKNLLKFGKGEIPFFLYFPADRHLLSDKLEIETHPWGYVFTDQILTLDKNKKEARLTDLVNEFFAGRTFSHANEEYSLSASIHDSTPIPLKRLPSGEKQALVLLSLIDRYLKPNSLVLIDEFELSLHPTNQRRLFHILSKALLKHNCQLIIATHSLELIRASKETEIFNLDDICGGEIV